MGKVTKKKATKKPARKVKKTAAPKRKNPIGLNGIEFIEFASREPQKLRNLFKEFGFNLVAHHKTLAVELYKQNDINFVLNLEPGTHAFDFVGKHGPCVPSMGWRVKDAKKAIALAAKNGAKVCKKGDLPVPAIYGVGDSLIYFVEEKKTAPYKDWGFVPVKDPNPVKARGFTIVDHLTNNVHKGTMKALADFYKNVFGFYEVRYFDIRGVQTGLTSFALRSPCDKFCIPINEGTEAKSQINEYLEEYKGPGVQHIAFLTDDINYSVESLKSTSIETLDIDDDYYQTVFDRVPNVTEDHQRLQKNQILVDGDDKGYLLQIFTKNVIGPIFIEIIQRKNNLSFGEGNFGALFRSIERDQMKRGYLQAAK